MSIVLKQNGRIAYYLVTGTSLAPGAKFWYARGGMPAGSYDVVVTLTLNGKTATARDITFTVG
jgi:hypothetical protein